MAGMNADMMSTSKLIPIFEAFLKGNLPKDDTMIEKFGGLLKNELSKILDTSVVLNTLEKLNQQTAPNAQTVTFFLKTASHLPLESGSEVTKQTWSLYEKVSASDLWTTAAVRCAWLTGLCNMASRDQTSIHVIDWIMQEEYGYKFFSSLTDSSLFVSKSAMELASVLLSSAMNYISQCDSPTVLPGNLKDHEESSSAPMKLSERFWSLFQKSISEGNSLRLPLLTVVEKVTVACSANLLETICHKHNLADTLCNALKPKDEKISNMERNVCLDILRHFRRVLTDSDVEKYEKLSKDLVFSGDIKTAMCLACWLLTCHGDKVKDKGCLKDIAFVVISTAAASESDSANLQTMHQQLLKQAKSFLSLILAQFDVMRTYHNTQDIPLEYLHGMVDLFCGFGFRSPGVLMAKVKGKEPALKNGLLDTFNHIFEVRPASRNKPVMVRLVMSCYAEVVQSVSVSLIQKTLKTMLISIVYMTCSVEFDKEQEAFVQKMKDIGWDMSESLFPPQDEDSTEENPGPMIDEVLSAWPVVICTGKRLLSDTRWEVVDSVTELLTQVLIQMKGVSMIQKGFYQNEYGGLDKSVIHNMEHPESYVRASSLKCVAAMAAIPGIWDHIIESHPKEEMLKKVISIAKDDSEAFARRSAVHTLTVFYSTSCYEADQAEIVGVMCQIMRDLDWEVKRNVLEFWSKYISAHGQGKEEDLSPLVTSGCLKSLLEAAHDCDKVVQETACKMLQPIQQKISQEPSISKKSRMCSSGPDEADKPDCSTDLVQKLADMDLESLLHVSTLSTDQYDLYPETLLDDIYSSVVTNVDTSGAEDGQEDNAIDCY